MTKKVDSKQHQYKVKTDTSFVNVQGFMQSFSDMLYWLCIGFLFGMGITLLIVGN